MTLAARSITGRVTLTDAGRELRSRAGCLGDALLETSDYTPAQLGELNRQVRQLRDDIYRNLGQLGRSLLSQHKDIGVARKPDRSWK